MTKFSKKSFKNPRFKTWFCEADESIQQPARERRHKRAAPLLKPVPCRTQRYARSSIPVMTSILSWHPPLLYTPIDLAWASSNRCSSWLLCCLLVPTMGCFSIVWVSETSIYGCDLYWITLRIYIYIAIKGYFWLISSNISVICTSGRSFTCWARSGSSRAGSVKC